MEYVVLPDNEDVRKTEQAYRILDEALEKIRSMGGRVTVAHAYILRGESVDASDLMPKFGKLVTGETRAVYRRMKERV